MAGGACGTVGDPVAYLAGPDYNTGTAFATTQDLPLVATTASAIIPPIGYVVMCNATVSV